MIFQLTDVVSKSGTRVIKLMRRTTSLTKLKSTQILMKIMPDNDKKLV